MISHALTIVMDQCPHHVTLLTCLLDIAIAYRLTRESRLLLHSLLAVALSPARGMPAPPICHPAHSSYLKQTCAKWTSVSDGDQGLATFFSDRTFARVLSEVLADVAIAEVWTCKAVSRFARHIQSSDCLGFLPMVDSLVQVVARRAKLFTSKHKSHKKEPDLSPQDDDDTVQLCDRLSRWLNVISVRPVLSSATLPPMADEESEHEYRSIIHILACAQPIALYPLPRSTKIEDPYREVQDALASLATRMLSSSLFEACSPAQSASILAILQSIKPLTSTYDEIVKHVFPSSNSTTDPSARLPTPPPSLQDSLQSLHAYAMTLRAHSLGALEASLWTCALRHFEREVTLSSSANGREIGEVRNQLMDAVSEAEQRLCGATTQTQVSQGSTSGEDDSERDGDTPGAEWEWEEMIGSWVRRSPVVKKARPGLANRRMKTRSSGPLQSKRSSPVPAFGERAMTIHSSSQAGTTRPAPPTARETWKKTNSTPSLPNFLSSRSPIPTQSIASTSAYTPPRPSTPKASSLPSIPPSPSTPSRRPAKKLKVAASSTTTRTTSASKRSTPGLQSISAPIPRRTPSARSIISSTSSSTRKATSIATLSSTSSRSSRSATPATEVEDDLPIANRVKHESEGDEDDFDELLTPRKKMKMAKLTNFRFMLSDSHLNAICLHPERASAKKHVQVSASAPPKMSTAHTARYAASSSRFTTPVHRASPTRSSGSRMQYDRDSMSSEVEDDEEGSEDDSEDEQDSDGSLDRIRGRLSLGQESMSSDDVLDLFAYDDSV